MNRSLTTAALFILFIVDMARAQEPIAMPFGQSASYRWMNKPVLESRLLDDMEDLFNWKGFSIGGAPIVDARATRRAATVGNVADVSLTTAFVHSGSKALRLHTP